MTNDDDLDIDIDTPDEQEPDSGGKPSLKEVWESNPMLKIAALVLGVALLLGVYFIFFNAKDEGPKSMVRVSSETKQVPGQSELDPAYRKALEETNKKAAEAAAQSGGSALPTPIGTAKVSGLDVPVMPEKPKTDPLAEWRKATEARRNAVEKEAPPEQGVAPPPEVVPMAQPVRPPVTLKRDPEAAKRLAEQMRVIIGAQVPGKSTLTILTPKASEYVEMTKAEAEAKEKAKTAQQNQLAAGGTPCTGTACTASSGTGTEGSGIAPPDKIIVPAGSIAYAQLMTELNSDIMGPALVQILSGPFAGGRAIGKVEVKSDFGDYMVLTFNTVVFDTVSYKINGIAMDEKTTLTGQATDVEHHYLARIILPAAAKFIEGYGSALSQTGTTVSQTPGGGQEASTPVPNPKQSIFKGVEESSKVVSDMILKNAGQPVTVKIAKGTTMGIFFMDQVTTGDAGK
jgi:intracellular multiplication protein IcmE